MVLLTIVKDAYFMIARIFRAKKTAGVIFLFVWVCFTARSYGNDSNLPDDSAKQAVMAKVAREYIAAAEKQYQRGLYRHSEESLLQAEKYAEYLTAKEWAKARALAMKVHALAAEQKEDSAKSRIAKAGAKIKLEQTAVAEEIGDSEQAFVNSEKPAQPAAASEQGKLTNKEKMVRSYARAVAEDAVSKAKQFLNDGQFFKAKESIAKAETTLEENRQMIGDAVFNEYKAQLDAMSQEVEKGRQRWLGEWDGKKAWRL